MHDAIGALPTAFAYIQNRPAQTHVPMTQMTQFALQR